MKMRDLDESPAGAQGNNTSSGVLSRQQQIISDVDASTEVQDLIELFKTTKIQLQWFIQRGRENEKIRFMRWLGQSKDQRKHGNKPFPYDGASDMKVPLVEAYMSYRTNAAMAASKRMRVSAVPMSSSQDGICKARTVSDFVRFLLAVIPDYAAQKERMCNDAQTYGVSFVTPYWDKRTMRTQKTLDLQDLPPEVEEALGTPEGLDMAVKVFYEQGPELGFELESEDHAREVLEELRDEGKATVHRVTDKIDQGAIFTLSPIEDIFFPANTIDVQTAPYYFQVIYYPVKDLRAKIEHDGWDPKFVKYCEEYLVGKDSLGLILDARPVASDYNGLVDKLKNTVQICHCFQKKTDKYGVMGVEETVFTGGYKKSFARKGLSDYEHGMYPVEAFKLEETSKRLYDSRGLPELLEGSQNNYKTEVDMNNDRNALATCPPRTRMVGRDSTAGVFGPGGEIYVRRENEIGFLQPSPFNAGTEYMMKIHLQLANRIAGRAGEDISPQEASIILQGFLDKEADMEARLASQLFKLWKQYGPASTFYQVLGTQDFLEYKKEDNDEFYFKIMLDNVYQDWERIQGEIELMIKVAALDPTVAGVGALIKEAFNMINPAIGDRVMQGSEDARDKSVQEENSAIAQATSGIKLDVAIKDMKNQIKAQTFMQWLQQPIGQKLANDPLVGEAVQHRAQQWQQAMVQMQNAQVGRYGNQPSGVTAGAAA